MLSSIEKIKINICKNFKFSNFCSEFFYYIEQSLNNFRNQNHDIHNVCNIIINKEKNNEKIAI